MAVQDVMDGRSAYQVLESAIQKDAAELENFIFEFVKIPSENPPGMHCRTRPASLGLDLLLFLFLLSLVTLSARQRRNNLKEPVTAKDGLPGLGKIHEGE